MQTIYQTAEPFDLLLKNQEPAAGQIYRPMNYVVEQPVEEIARRSVNLLLDMMEKGAAPRHILVKAVFRNRDSVAAPRILP